MTEELTKAAQMAMVVLQHYIHGGSEYRKPAEAAIAALNRALTQRQEAQTEREAPRWTVSIEPVAVSGETDAHCLRASIGNQSFHIGPDYMDTKQEAEFFAEMFLHAIEVGHRASIPAPQQATHEPVGEPDAVWIDLKDGDTVQLGDRLLSGGKTWRTVDQESQLAGREYLTTHWWPMQRTFTHPAPVVPEDTARLNWLLRHLPGDAIKRCVGELSDTSDGTEFRKAIDEARKGDAALPAAKAKEQGQ